MTSRRVAPGHSRLAQLMGPEDIWSFEGRASGFRGAVVRAGASWVDVAGSGRLPTVEEGRQLATALIEREGRPPTGLFAHNDSIAIGAIAALREHGLECPADVSVVGYNDIPLTDQLRPPLTTIRLPGYELGRLAAELVVTRIEGTEPTTEKVLLAPELIVRESTGELDET